MVAEEKVGNGQLDLRLSGRVLSSVVTPLGKAKRLYVMDGAERNATVMVPPEFVVPGQLEGFPVRARGKAYKGQVSVSFFARDGWPERGAEREG